jgi:hypothetical protein
MKKTLFFLLALLNVAKTTAQQNAFQVQGGILNNWYSKNPFNLNSGTFNRIQTNRFGYHYGISYSQLFWENTSIRYGAFWNEENYSEFTSGCFSSTHETVKNKFIELAFLVRKEYLKNHFFVEYGISPYLYLHTERIDTFNRPATKTVEKEPNNQTKTRLYFNTSFGYQYLWKAHWQLFVQAELQARAVGFVRFENTPTNLFQKSYLETRSGASLGVRYLLN